MVEGIMVNVRLLLELQDCAQALVYTYLEGYYRELYENGSITEGAPFIYTMEQMKSELGISNARQRTILKSLKAKRLIELRLVGSPPKRQITLITKETKENKNEKK